MQEFISHVIAVTLMIAMFFIALMPRRHRLSQVDEVMCEKHYHQLKLQISDCRNQFVLYRIFQEAQEFFESYGSRVDQEKLNRYWDDIKNSIDVKASELR